MQKVCLKPALRQQVVPDARQSPPALHLSPNPGLGDQSRIVQAANTLILSAFDRECLNYLQNSTLVILLGKHWPWSTIAYAYTRIAVTEPMVMSMMLASTAREIHRMRRYDQGEHFVSSTITDQTTDLDGRMHYGRALSSLRVALRSEVKSPQKIEAIFITLWLMIDYENRFGGGASAIDIHTRGIESLLLNHVIPCLQTEIYRPFKYLSNTSSVEFEDTRVSRHPQPDGSALKSYNVEEVTGKPKELPTTSVSPSAGLGKTSVPLFLLWTLYFFTPTSWSFSSATGELDLMTFEFFLDTNGSHHKAPFPLAELYRISRQSPARFWGDSYTMTARMDDLENVAPLTLYHQSHILQFKITEQYKRGVPTEPLESGLSAYQKLVDEINSIATVRGKPFSLSLFAFSTPPPPLFFSSSFSPVLTNKTGTRHRPRISNNVRVERLSHIPPNNRNKLLGHHHFLQHHRILPLVFPRYHDPARTGPSTSIPTFHVSHNGSISHSGPESQTLPVKTASDCSNYVALVSGRSGYLGSNLSGLGVDSVAGIRSLWTEFCAYQSAV